MKQTSGPPAPPVATDSMADVIRLYRRDVDLSLLRRQLARTHEERFLDVMERQAAAEEFRRDGREARRHR